jgi:hypothetical protein
MDGSPWLRSAHRALSGTASVSLAEFAEKSGCTEVASAAAFVEEFVTIWSSQHAAKAKTAESLRNFRFKNAQCLHHGEPTFCR